MNIPKQVTIGPHVIKIRLIKGLRLYEDADGLFNHLNREIQIDDNLSEIRTLEVFLHEINEAIIWIFDIEDTDHHIISLIATGMAQALKPLLLKKIPKGVKSKNDRN